MTFRFFEWGLGKGDLRSIFRKIRKRILCNGMLSLVLLKTFEIVIGLAIVVPSTDRLLGVPVGILLIFKIDFKRFHVSLILLQLDSK